MPTDIVYVAGKDPLFERGDGHTSYVRAHARAALRAGFMPHLFCASVTSGTVESEFGIVHRLRSPGLRLQPTGRSPRYFFLIVEHVFRLARAIEAFVRARTGTTLVHGFAVWGAAGVVASRRSARGAAVPILSTYTTGAHESRAKVRGASPAHDRRARFSAHVEDLWTRSVAQRYERRAHLGARLVVVNYESVRRLVVAKYPVASKCRRLPYTSESAFAPTETAAVLRHDGGPPLVAAVSRHDPRKGVDVLLHALARLRAAGVPFRAAVVGGGPLLASHRRLATSLGLADSTSILGFVPDARAWLRAADAFVLPSLQEGSGSLSLIEALECGLPAVASACDGIPEDVVDGESALLVPPGDPDALAGALARVLADPALRRKLACGARAVFAQRFSAERFTEALGATYREALASP
jgi:glycosyltransferase involved in cell wall biosynthesis